MEKKILYTEYAPDKKFLWLHSKNNELILEGFGPKGWTPINIVPQQEVSIEDILKEVKKQHSDDSKKITPIKLNLPLLDTGCSKKQLIETIEKLKNALAKAGIVEF
jgi:hypothetical protein